MDFTLDDPVFADRWNNHISTMCRYWKPRPKHVIFTDSRGKGLENAILVNHGSDPIFTTRKCDGLSIKELMVAADQHLTGFPRDIIYIFGGQCDVTYKDRRTKKIYCKWSSSAELCSHLCAYTEVGLDWLKFNHEESKVVICPLTGTDVSKKIANNHPALQNIVDQGIQDFNHVVSDLNSMSEVATPWTANHYFKSRHGKQSIQYDLLANDGIHPTTKLTELWAQDFANCMPKNPLMLTHDSCY